MASQGCKEPAAINVKTDCSMERHSTGTVMTRGAEVTQGTGMALALLTDCGFGLASVGFLNRKNESNSALPGGSLIQGSNSSHDGHKVIISNSVVVEIWSYDELPASDIK